MLTLNGGRDKVSGKDVSPCSWISTSGLFRYGGIDTWSHSPETSRAQALRRRSMSSCVVRNQTGSAQQRSATFQHPHNHGDPETEDLREAHNKILGLALHAESTACKAARKDS